MLPGMKWSQGKLVGFLTLLPRIIQKCSPFQFCQRLGPIPVKGKETGVRGARTQGHPLGVKSSFLLQYQFPLAPVVLIPRDFFPSYHVAQA